MQFHGDCKINVDKGSTNTNNRFTYITRPTRIEKHIHTHTHTSRIRYHSNAEIGMSNVHTLLERNDPSRLFNYLIYTADNQPHGDGGEKEKEEEKNANSYQIRHIRYTVCG